MLDSSLDINQITLNARTVERVGAKRARYVTPDLSYSWKKDKKKCEDNKWDEDKILNGRDTSTHIGATITGQEGWDGLDIYGCCTLPVQEKYHKYTITCWWCSVVTLKIRQLAVHAHTTRRFAMMSTRCTSNSSIFHIYDVSNLVQVASVIIR